MLFRSALLESRRNTFLTSPGNKVYHDLFTVISYDQSASETIDVVIKNPSSTPTTEHIYHTSTVAGLKVAGSTSLPDTLVLGAQLSFDFTGKAATTNIQHIEKIDITEGASTIKLSMESLAQADEVSHMYRRLFIDGDSNDTVQLNSTLGTLTNHVAPQLVNGYNIYHIDSTHELLIQQAITNITFVS